MAPVDRRAQGALAVGRVARAASERRPARVRVGRAAARTSSSVVRAAASSIASGSPSRRRQISATAPALPSVSSKPAVVAAGALDEQRAGRGLRDGGRVGLCGTAVGRRRAVLGLQSQRLAAGRQHGQPRSGGQQVADQRRRRQEVLEVVEHQQHVLRGEEALDRKLGRLALQRCDAQRPARSRSGRASALAVAASETNQRRRGARARARARPPAPAASCPPRQAGQRDQPDLVRRSSCSDGLAVLLAADRAGRRDRQPARRHLGRLRPPAQASAGSCARIARSSSRSRSPGSIPSSSTRVLRASW